MLLSIHTCAAAGSVALGRITGDGVRVLHLLKLAPRAYAAELVPGIRELLTGQGATLKEIEAIAVVNGPGSFTGVRVGVSAAKGLAQPSGIRLIPLSRLELVARVSGLPHTLVGVDAGRGEYYAGEYRDGEKVWESLLGREELLATASHPGAGVLVYEQASEPSQAVHGKEALMEIHPLYVQPPDAGDALRIALDHLRARRFVDAAALEANYLRRPDAEAALAAREHQALRGK